MQNHGLEKILKKKRKVHYATITLANEAKDFTAKFSTFINFFSDQFFISEKRFQSIFVVVVPFIFRILVQYETFLLGHKDLLL